MKAHFWAKATCLALALLVADTYATAMTDIYQNITSALTFGEDLDDVGG